ncbi:unnamed protein product [Mesocestoides corti]|uniref:Uncharacterized protein n=1 Tax=Mesocestoides corti TaxID=53468 RepID=A0A0R3U5N2_MESCO|nr:unnamed protein product [Mesocestoides corti]
MVEAHEDVVNRLSSLLGSDAETLAALYRLNTEMRAKCNCALDEARKSRLLYDTQLSELKNELIHVIDQLKRSNSENSTLKAKCDALTEQADMLKGSLARTQADLKTSRQKAIDCEQSKLNTEKHFEKLLQRSRTELSDYRVEFQRQREYILTKKYIFDFFLLTELTNQIAIAFAKFEETEEMHRQMEHEAETRESDLRKSAAELKAESDERLAKMLRQLEHTQMTLQESTAHQKSLALALAESENSKNEALRKLSSLTSQNDGLREELTRTKQELRASQREIASLESTLKELSTHEAQTLERDHTKSGAQAEGDNAYELAGVREAYSRSLEKLKSVSL